MERRDKGYGEFAIHYDDAPLFRAGRLHSTIETLTLGVRSEFSWLCLLNNSFVTTKPELSRNIRKGVTNESFSEIITYNLALPIPYSLDPKIQVSSDRRGNS